MRLLGSERSREALEGVAMELEDCLFPLLREVDIGIDCRKVFAGADWALLIGAKPRGPGMERGDLLEMNGAIFVDQGKALNEVAKPTCKVMRRREPLQHERAHRAVARAQLGSAQLPRVDASSTKTEPSVNSRSRRACSTKP